jgi:DNA replication and repair protein RecF
MFLSELRTANFRLLRDGTLTLHPRFNLIVGGNGAGKTSLLEALYCVARGRSFRGQSAAELAGSAGRHWSVAALHRTDDYPASRLQACWQNGATTLLRDDQAQTAVDWVRRLPAQILEPGMHRLLQDGPGYRRSFLDWGVFHVEHSFHPVWRRYRRAQRQRNQALRGASDRAVRAWDPELVAAGTELHAMRQQHLGEISAGAGALAAALLGADGFGLELRSGWGEEPLEQRLHQQLARDRRVGMTAEGPHRAELLLKLGTHSVRSRASRGQQKLLIAALLLAQCELIWRRSGYAPLLLVDDFSAELALPAQAALLQALRAYPGQVVVTAFEQGGVLASPPQGAMFHVEQGHLTPLQC